MRAFRDGPRVASLLLCGVLVLTWILGPSTSEAQPISTQATVGPGTSATLGSATQTLDSQPVVAGSAEPEGNFQDSALSDLLGSLASLATVLGVPIAIAAAFLAIKSLRSQANSQKLEAILTTNEFWNEVQLRDFRPSFPLLRDGEGDPTRLQRLDVVDGLFLARWRCR